MFGSANLQTIDSASTSSSMDSSYSYAANIPAKVTDFKIIRVIISSEKPRLGLSS